MTTSSYSAKRRELMNCRFAVSYFILLLPPPIVANR